MKARTSQLVKCFTIHGFLVQQQVHSQPIWSCKMQRKNITNSFRDISLLAGDSLNIFYVACKTLLISQSVSISPVTRAPYNTWRPQLPTRSMSVGKLIFFSVTGMNFEYIPVNIRPIHQYLQHFPKLRMYKDSKSLSRRLWLLGHFKKAESK